MLYENQKHMCFSQYSTYLMKCTCLKLSLTWLISLIKHKAVAKQRAVLTNLSRNPHSKTMKKILGD